MTAQYYTKNVYGNQMIYLVESPEANAIRCLTSRKTLCGADIEALKVLGVQLDRVFEPSKYKTN